MAPEINDLQDWANRKTGANDPTEAGPGGSENLEPEGGAVGTGDPADVMFDVAGQLNAQADALEQIKDSLDDSQVVADIIENLRTNAGDLEAAADELSGGDGEDDKEDGDEDLGGDEPITTGEEGAV